MVFRAGLKNAYLHLLFKFQTGDDPVESIQVLAVISIFKNHVANVDITIANGQKHGPRFKIGDHIGPIRSWFGNLHGVLLTGFEMNCLGPG